jgi:nitrate/TMAO reductase-like tetraheme cytochrome c subunit
MQPRSFSIVIFLALAGFILVLIPVTVASANSCIDCHKTLSHIVELQQQSNMTFQQQFNQTLIKEHIQRNVTCSLECHQDISIQLLPSNFQQWSESVHALKGVTCDICHGGDPNQSTKDRAHLGIQNITDINSLVYYTNVPNTCGKCHKKELANFENSTHYQKLEALETAPTCATCHEPHTFSILSPEEFKNFCANCHSVYTKVAPYDAPVQAEYLLGKVNKLKSSIQTAQQDIFWAKKNGTDVVQAEQLTNNALQTVQNLPTMWHDFNLTHFESEVDSASNQVKKAEELINPTPTPTATTAPGFTGVSGIISMLAVVYMFRKNLVV